MKAKQAESRTDNKLDLEAFKERLKTVTCATSIDGTSVYSDFHFDDNSIRGTRFQPDFTKSNFNINLQKLHDAYCAQDEHNTATLKKYTGGVQSPALAILLKAGLTVYKHRK